MIWRGNPGDESPLVERRLSIARALRAFLAAVAIAVTVVTLVSWFPARRHMRMLADQVGDLGASGIVVLVDGLSRLGLADQDEHASMDHGGDRAP